MQKQSLIKFPNGFKVVFSGKDSHTVGITLNIPYGVEKEAFRQSGISHLIERLVYNDLSKQIDRYNGELRTKVTFEYIEISILTIRQNIAKILTALSRSIFDFTPKMDDFKRAKKMVVDNLEKNKLAPNYILEKLTNESLYKKSGLSNNFYGVLASISKIELDEVKQYLAKIISPNNLVLSIVGDIENANYKDDEDMRYSDIYSIVMEEFYGKLLSYRNHNAKFSEEIINKTKLYSEKTKLLYQDRFLIAYPCASYNSKNYKYVRLIDNYIQKYLEDYASNKDYIYGLKVELVKYANNGYIKVLFAVDEDMAEEVYYKIISLIDDIRVQGISIGEFDKLKNSYIAKVIFNNESVVDLSKSYAKKLALRGEVFDLDLEIEDINGLQYDNFKIVMTETLSKKSISVARVGKKRDDFIPFGERYEI